GRIFYRTDVHQFGGLPAAAPLGANDPANLDFLHAEACAEFPRLRATLLTQVALGRAVIELIVNRIADCARSRSVADQRNMTVATERGPCGRSVVGGISRAADQHARDEKREVDGRLLCPCLERPRNRCSGNPSNKFSPSHCCRPRRSTRAIVLDGGYPFEECCVSALGQPSGKLQKFCEGSLVCASETDFGPTPSG